MTSRAEPSIWHYFGFLLFSIAFLILSDLSVTWLVLLTCSLVFGAICFWFKNIKLILFLGFVFCSSIHLTKALIVEGGIYTPGLSLSISDVFLIPLTFIWLAEKKFFLKQKIYWSKLHLPPLLFLLWLWFSALVAEDHFAGILMCISYTKYFLIFTLLSDFISSPQYLRYALFAFALGMCAHFTLAFLEVGLGRGIAIQGAKTTTLGTRLVFEQAGGVHAFRPSGFAGHPNALANILVFTLPTFLILVILGRRFLGFESHFLVTGIFAVGIVVLILTLSRGAWISFTCSLIYMFYIGYKRGIIPKRHIQAILTCALIGGLATVAIFPTALLRITESDQRSGESRIVMMKQAALIIQRNPIFGVGIAGYNGAARTNIPESFSRLSPWFQDELLKGVVHNKYLLVMSETGIVGFALFVLMLYRFLIVVPKGDFWTNPLFFSLALGFTAGVFGQAVFYMVDHFYADPRITMLYLFFGFIGSIVKLQKEENEVLQRVSA